LVANDRPVNEVRTAVVFVHGLFERRPLENLDAFAKTALDPRRPYYARPSEITDSYEARRYVSPGSDDHVEADVFEYHWSFHATGNRYAGLMPMALRLFLRRPGNVPDPLFGIWRVVWTVILAPILLATCLLAIGWYFLSTGVPAWLVGLVSSVIVLAVGLGVFRFVATTLRRSFITTGFVDVARYLDPLPDSYAARRAIREGLVDLLYTLQQGWYSRIVVVAHGVGAYIAYDALTSLWAETHELHAGPPTDAATPGPIELKARSGLEACADRLLAEPDGDGALDEFQAAQFALWQDLRWQGNPWRITDFITIGTPMTLADVLVTRPPIASGLAKSDDTRRRELFDALMRRGGAVRCPPRSETLPVDGTDHGHVAYGWNQDGMREVLGSQSPFAVTRWTNLWFPVIRGGLRGDWFGGALAPLFGLGVRDIAVQGNEPERFKRGAAQTEYFTHPDKGDQGDVAWHLRNTLALQPDPVLDRLLDAPHPDPDTVSRQVHRSWQRSS
jgi:hypothetical protein